MRHAAVFVVCMYNMYHSTVGIVLGGMCGGGQFVNASTASLYRQMHWHALEHDSRTTVVSLAVALSGFAAININMCQQHVRATGHALLLVCAGPC